MSPRPRQTSVEVVWEEPPQANRVGSMYDAAIMEVQKASGEWARIRIFESPGSAYNARKAFLRRATEEPWEAKVMKLDDGSLHHGLWVRYRTPEQMLEG